MQRRISHNRHHQKSKSFSLCEAHSDGKRSSSFPPDTLRPHSLSLPSTPITNHLLVTRQTTITDSSEESEGVTSVEEGVDTVEVEKEESDCNSADTETTCVDSSSEDCSLNDTVRQPVARSPLDHKAVDSEVITSLSPKNFHQQTLTTLFLQNIGGAQYYHQICSPTKLISILIILL